ncbi:MAG: antibiotic biosynthesis monooxygenase family protein [Clostridia bacterium]
MIYIVATNFVKKEDHEIYLEITKEQIECTRKEEGCLQYVLAKNDKNPDTLVYLEKWESPEAFAAHGQTEHMKRIKPLLMPYRYKDTDVQILEDAHGEF